MAQYSAHSYHLTHNDIIYDASDEHNSSSHHTGGSYTWLHHNTLGYYTNWYVWSCMHAYTWAILFAIIMQLFSIMYQSPLLHQYVYQ